MAARCPKATQYGTQNDNPKEDGYSPSHNANHHCKHSTAAVPFCTAGAVGVVPCCRRPRSWPQESEGCAAAAVHDDCPLHEYALLYEHGSNGLKIPLQTLPCKLPGLLPLLLDAWRFPFCGALLVAWRSLHDDALGSLHG